MPTGRAATAPSSACQVRGGQRHTGSSETQTPVCPVSRLGDSSLLGSAGSAHGASTASTLCSPNPTRSLPSLLMPQEAKAGGEKGPVTGQFPRSRAPAGRSGTEPRVQRGTRHQGRNISFPATSSRTDTHPPPFPNEVTAGGDSGCPEPPWRVARRETVTGARPAPEARLVSPVTRPPW